MNKYTKSDLLKMWERPPERQYNIAISKILEAINSTGGGITICFSGGKDSSLLLDMYCEVLTNTKYRDEPIKVAFADTTNETAEMYRFVDFFIDYVSTKYGVKIDFQKIRPPHNLTWAKFIKENGIPLISKEQSKAIRIVKQDMIRTGCDYDTVCKFANSDKKSVEELFDIGFTKTGVLSLTGYVYSRDSFGKMFVLSKKWLPMVNCDVSLTNLCCSRIKEAALNEIGVKDRMTGEQAQESKNREVSYLHTGCNARIKDGSYVSKPFGAMTRDGILWSLDFRKTPICGDYGDIVRGPDGKFVCTKANRTGCALCGFGCQYDTERFLRLQETEPSKVKFAFKPISEGGAGYKEAIEYMNEYCGTRVYVPKL